jgi:hypothetical protein
MSRKTATGVSTVPSNGRANEQRFSWEHMTQRDLLSVRMCDLNVSIEGTWLEERIERVRDELAQRDLRFNPHFWLADEWFSPAGVPGVALPFYLAHPKLVRLERSQMLEAEGATRESCLRLLRHELGHAIQHAFNLQRRREWQRRFGRASTPYPDAYRPNPASRRYVHNLEYVDRLMHEIAGESPRVRSRAKPYATSRERMTLGEYYERKRSHYSVGFSDAYDRDLKRLFSEAEGPRDRRETAAAFLRRHRREIRGMVAKWTGEYQLTLNQVLEQMIGRCKQLHLVADGPERNLVLDFAIMLTVHGMNYLYRGREWHVM